MALSQWVGEQLTQLLGFDASGDFSSYLLSIETKEDLEDYLQDILDTSNYKHKKFIGELLKRWRPSARAVTQSVPEGVTVYKKETDAEQVKATVTKSSRKSAQSSSQPKAVKDVSEPVVEHKPQSQPSPKPLTTPPKTKFVPLFDTEGRDRSIIKIPGRHPCICQGHKHGLINNCLSCGRVVCKQEGSGPCVFCGNLVCTEDDQEIIDRGSRKGEKRYDSLMNGSAVPKFPPQQEDVQSQKAKAHKDKLINYDKSSAHRTKVIDDESDYYATDSKWLDMKEREQLQKKKDARDARMHASRRDKKITIDFAGRRLVDSTYDTGDLDEAANDDSRSFQDITNMHQRVTSGITNPAYVPSSHKPQFQQDEGSMTASRARPTDTLSSSKLRYQLRLQDKGLQEVVDNGMCLSMHQPWAGLLIAGIKIHEGRTWYSSHRGRLWIAATAKAPSEPEIDSLQQEYTQRAGRDRLAFPPSYPQSCLLGCVDVVDVLPQEEYRQQYPDGESGSPYVFICEYPQELRLKFPIKGQHKLYKLESQMHKAARMGLRIASS